MRSAGTGPAPVKAPAKGPVTIARRVVPAAVALVLSLVVGIVTDGPTVWGLLPVALYAVLSLTGTDLVAVTAVSLVSAVLVALPPVADAAGVLGASVSDPVTIIGLIIVLGSAVGEILRVTGVADAMVRGILRVAGGRGHTALMYAMMIACLVLVTSLGTLAGALAIAAPLLIPVAARAGFTRSATAVTMFLGGCAGLALAPFAGSNVAIMKVADTDYLTYLMVGAGPLALLSLLLAAVVVPRVQRLSAARDDFYGPDEAAEQEPNGRTAAGTRRATYAFLITLIGTVVYATWTKAGTTFPLIALPLMAVVTAVAARLSLRHALRAVVTGGRRMLPTLLLFWMLAALFGFIELLHPYDVVLDTFGPGLREMSPLPFALAIAALGWVGVPGATAAQVVLIGEVFGPLGTGLGIGPAAWVIILLWASKADTYGPLPNANMVGAMGVARATRLPYLLGAGWALLVPACALYTVLLALLL
ncbi:Na+/H+ antiporter NhaC family protein [Streptosporangium sp. NBC_01756]|uniref:Na+/H+ antiporter NhaC family protein n=1 Tax=Streptosporangium sp. NBC_01756 TaxID=2975950 RepID=UPI002DD7A1AF|nr:Na+/H+ antiporter NhaC family protein [Streptosporangium sp. NBC_01756]WSC83327.1 Na+/H+ antiporter NhaC family protein [Streptosporangium sp. NBC_01756]